MRKLINILLAVLAAFTGLLAPAAQAQILSIETYIEEWDSAQQKWVRIEDSANRLAQSQLTQEQLAKGNFAVQAVAPPAQAGKALAIYGAFRVVDQNHAEMVGATDRTSPADFASMLKAFPNISTLRLIDAPGTSDDRANMRVGRMIRAAGITTHVPRGGSARSGAVELFLSGVERRIDDGAQFAVHSWMDIYGRSPSDFAENAGPNKMYLDYYREMGMDADQARKFYAMTNSVGFRDVKWLTAQDMRGWLNMDAAPAVPEVQFAKIESAPVMAYLDLDTLLP